MKIFKILAVLFLSAVLAMSSFAVETYGNGSVTVEFEEDTSFTEDEQKAIADMIINGTDDETSTYNILCTLFGHDTINESVSATRHKVYDESPRCLRKSYLVTTCSRCDYQELELVYETYVVCCPEEIITLAE